MDRGMLVNPASASSTMYTSVPSNVTSTSTVDKNTAIFRRLASRASRRIWASRRNPTSFRTRKTRNKRSMRTTRKLAAPGTSNSTNVGKMLSRSTQP